MKRSGLEFSGLSNYVNSPTWKGLEKSLLEWCVYLDSGLMEMLSALKGGRFGCRS